MPTPHKAWAVLADDRRAKLLHCGTSERGSPHVEHVDSLTRSWEGHQRGRPSPLKGKSSHTHADPGHDAEEERRRFAQELANWLVQRSREHSIDRLTLFGATRFVSTFREVCPGDLTQRLHTEAVELINLPNAELHQHPVIRSLIGLNEQTTPR